MSMKFRVACVFLFGMGLGAAAVASVPPPSITPQMAACVAASCTGLSGSAYSACFSCCVHTGGNGPCPAGGVN
ncbi:hypothetical protein [Dyella tabacisoli]|uniref:hypothetical protein n=1 Tax=Dyella tabacisoli TaxID=2282381 RepID=UPI0013B36F3F|nr:hypothetical protein [Dyella tabacisoli]